MKIIPLSKVCSRIVDCPHETPEWKETGIPVIRNYNLVDGHIDTSNLSFVDEETYLRVKHQSVIVALSLMLSNVVSVKGLFC